LPREVRVEGRRELAPAKPSALSCRGAVHMPNRRPCPPSAGGDRHTRISLVLAGAVRSGNGARITRLGPTRQRTVVCTSPDVTGEAADAADLEEAAAPVIGVDVAYDDLAAMRALVVLAHAVHTELAIVAAMRRLVARRIVDRCLGDLHFRTC